MLSIFSCVFWTSICLLCRNIYLNLLPIFRLNCFFDIEVHKLFILEINPLSVASFANILSYSVSWLLVLITVSFSVHNLLSTPYFHFAGSRVIAIVKHLSTFLLPTLSTLWDNRGWKDGTRSMVVYVSQRRKVGFKLGESLPTQR